MGKSGIWEGGRRSEGKSKQVFGIKGEGGKVGKEEHEPVRKCSKG